MVKAGDNKCRAVCQSKSGMDIAGRDWGMPPNLVPMVATSRCSTRTARVPTATATMVPGIRDK